MNAVAAAAAAPAAGKTAARPSTLGSTAAGISAVTTVGGAVYSAIKNDSGPNVKKGKVEQYHFFI